MLATQTVSVCENVGKLEIITKIRIKIILLFIVLKFNHEKLLFVLVPYIFWNWVWAWLKRGKNVSIKQVKTVKQHRKASKLKSFIMKYLWSVKLK